MMMTGSDPLGNMRDAVDAVTRYASRGCFGAACDRARGAWMSNQLGVVGSAAVAMPDAVRDKYADIPWEKLAALADPQHGVLAMTVDEMQHFVESTLSQVRKALRSRK